MHSRSRRVRWALAALWVVASSCAEPIPDQLLSSLDFLTGTPSFANYADEVEGWELRTEQAVRLFGADAVCVPGSSPCEATPQARVWIDEVNDTLKHGHSEGLALVTLAFRAKQLNPSDFGAATVAELTLSPALKAEIATWAATQKLPAAVRRDRSFQAKDVMQFLAQVLKPKQPEPWRLAFAIKDEAGFHAGHAVVPFGFFKGKKEGQFYVRVYDSNWPGQEQRVFVDTKANTWSYEGSLIPDAPRSYRGDAANGNLLYFSPLDAHRGPFEAPFSDSARSLVVAADGPGLQVSDEGGAKVGFAMDGTVTEAGGTVRPAFAQSRCVFCPAPAEVVNYTLSPDAGMGGRQIIDLTGFGNNTATGGTVTVTGAGVSAQVTGVRSDTGGAGLRVEGKTISYDTSATNAQTTFSVTVKTPSGDTKTVTVTLPKAPNGTVSIDTSDPNNIKVVTRSYDSQPTTAEVIVSTVRTDGTSGTTRATVESSSGKASTATIPATGMVTVSPVPGSRCDNGIHDPMLNGSTMGAETDVDCGGVCPKCRDRKLCGQGADCQSGVCAFGVCQEPTCFDNVKNRDEEDVDCGGFYCWGTCRIGQRCRNTRDCAGTVAPGGPTCIADQDAGVDGGPTRCQVHSPRTLRVTGLGPEAQFNLNGTLIDDVRYDDWRVTGNSAADVTVNFKAVRYTFQFDGGLPAPYQQNLSCRLINPTNDPNLLRLPGYGDGGQPSLDCRRIATTLVARTTGCTGLGVPLSAQVDGTGQTIDIPQTSAGIAGAPERGAATREIGTFNQSGSIGGLYRGSVRYGTSPTGLGMRQSCPDRSFAVYRSAVGERTWAQLNYDCTCEVGDFRGPTTVGNPCANAELLTTAINTGRLVQGTTAESSRNDFVFLPDSGCDAPADPRSSGSDKVYRVTVPAGADLSATGSLGFGLGLITSLAECGTNTSTSATTGTAGARCAQNNFLGVRHYNPGPNPQDVYLVLDGRDRGTQGPYNLRIATLAHATTALGSPCSSATPVSVTVPHPIRGTVNTVTGTINPTGSPNNFVFGADATGCTAQFPAAGSLRDVAYRFDVPSQTTVQVAFTRAACEVTANLVKGAACGTNTATSHQTGTSGLTCAAGSNRYGCAYALAYDNRSNSTESVYLVIEQTDAISQPNFTFEVRMYPFQLTQYSTVSGPAVDGNPCALAQVRTGSLQYTDVLTSTRNDFYVPQSSTCSTTSTDFGPISNHAPSGQDTALGYVLPAGHDLSLRLQSWRPGGLPPYFTTRLVVGEAACGTNGPDFVDAGTQGLVCAASTVSRMAADVDHVQTLSYSNSTAAAQTVFVVLDTLQPLAGTTSFELRATLTARADAGTADAGPPDAGPPDAGPPDAGPPDAGPPDAGPPDAGPPDAGPPDAGPPDAGGMTCSTDSQCPGSNNCYCTSEPGNCLGTGRCVPGRAVISTATDGGGVSGTFTVPTGCTQVHVSAWGAGGGQAREMFPGMTNYFGGAGGYVSGLLATTPGDVFTVWVGRGGANSDGIFGDESTGSYFGVPANGGATEVGATAGSGGGLTSVRQTGSATRSFTVPAGGGAALNGAAQPAGGAGSGTAMTFSGGDADVGSEGGGGGAGDKGGLGASGFRAAGASGAFGMLPSGLTSQVGQAPTFMMMVAPPPAASGTRNYALCPSDTGAGNGGNGCVVLRCTTP